MGLPAAAPTSHTRLQTEQQRSGSICRATHPAGLRCVGCKAAPRCCSLPPWLRTACRLHTARKQGEGFGRLAHCCGLETLQAGGLAAMHAGSCGGAARCRLPATPPAPRPHRQQRLCGVAAALAAVLPCALLPIISRHKKQGGFGRGGLCGETSSVAGQGEALGGACSLWLAIPELNRSRW